MSFLFFKSCVDERVLFLRELQRVERALETADEATLHLLRSINEAFDDDDAVRLDVHTRVAHEGAPHAIILHVPESAHLHSEAVVHVDCLDDGAERVCLHVHAWLLAWEVHFHHGVALGRHIRFVEGFGAFIRVAVHHDVLHACCRIVARPEELLAFLVAGQFLWSMEAAGKDLPGKVVGDFRVLVLEFFDESIHLRTRQEVDHFLFVVDAELLEVLQAWAVDGEHNLVHRELVTHEAHACSRVLCLIYVDLNDVTEYGEVGAEVFRLDLCDVERALTLRQAGHIGVKDIEESTTCRRLPSLVVEHDEHFVRTTAGLREELFLRAACQDEQAQY